MRRKLGIAGFGAVALALLMTFATVPTQGDLWSAHAGHCHIGDDCGVTLIAGKNTNAGKIEVTFDKVGLHVEYVASSPWTITETHLLVLTEQPPLDDSDYFNKNGNPKVGHFPYTGELSYDIPWGDIPGFTWCEPIYIIAHCVVSKTVGGVTTTETGYGDGTKFSKQWAMYFTCTPCQYKMITLPEGQVQVHYDGATSESYWTFYANTGTDIDNWHKGWCIETAHTVGEDTNNPRGYHTVTMYSSYDDLSGTSTGNVASITLAQWEKINWIINHDDGKTMKDTQLAIWHILALIPDAPGTALGTPWGYVNTGSSPGTLTLIADAEANAAGYHPSGEGAVIAVVLFVGTGTQDCILEVDP